MGLKGIYGSIELPSIYPYAAIPTDSRSLISCTRWPRISQRTHAFSSVQASSHKGATWRSNELEGRGTRGRGTKPETGNMGKKKKQRLRSMAPEFVNYRSPKGQDIDLHVEGSLKSDIVSFAAEDDVDLRIITENGTAVTKMVSITVHGIQDEADVAWLLAEVGKLEGVGDVFSGPFKKGGLRGGAVPLQIEIAEGVRLKEILESVHSIEDRLLALPFKSHSWEWRGHRISYAVAGCGKPIILVHGFGGNAGHFRNLIAHLADDHRVYAVDLLGFGDSDKPSEAEYSPELWADIINDFAQEFAEEPAVLIGNSIGSLTSLTAAAISPQNYRGMVLLNVAGAMNRKGLEKDDALLAFLSPIFVAIEFLLLKPKIASFLFNRFRNKANVRKILEEQVYRNKSAVTDQLVDILYEPSQHEGAVDVFVKVFTGNPGPRPEALVEQITLPMLVLWGDMDPWTPVDGAVARIFKRLESERENVSVIPLLDVGHCPHDDCPELVAEHVLPWIRSIDSPLQ